MLCLGQLLTLFNAIEAVWWLGLAALFAWRDLDIRELRGWPRWLLVTSLGCFGISDAIETQTGAWWQPIELMVLKIACIAGFVVAIVAVAIRERQKANASSD